MRKAADRLSLRCSCGAPPSRPQCVLQPLGERDVALAAEDDVRVLEARAGQAEVVQPVVQSDTGHRDAQAAHRGEVRQPQAARLVHLAEHDVAVLAVDGAPRADASLQGAPHAACQAGMPSQHLLQHGHRSNRWRGLQKWNDLGIGDLGQGVRAPPLARRLLLRWQARIVLEAVCRGGAESSTGGRSGRPFGESVLRVKPHLVVVDVSSGHGRPPQVWRVH